MDDNDKTKINNPKEAPEVEKKNQEKVSPEEKAKEFKEAVENKPTPPKSRFDSSQIIKSDPLQKESLSTRLKSWLVPIASVIVLGLMGMFIFIPSGTEALDALDEVRSTNEQIERNEEKIEKLNSINLSEINSMLQTVTFVIKDDLEVAELAGDVEAIARENNLETKNVQFSSTSSAPTDIPAFVSVISGPFSYEGNFNNIANFLEELRTVSPTVLAIRSVSLTRRGAVEETGTQEDPLWSVNLEIDGFIASKIDSVSVNEVVRVNINEELIKEIEDRAEFGEEITE